MRQDTGREEGHDGQIDGSRVINGWLGEVRLIKLSVKHESNRLGQKGLWVHERTREGEGGSGDGKERREL